MKVCLYAEYKEKRWKKYVEMQKKMNEGKKTKTIFFLIQMFYSPVCYLASLFWMPRQYFFLFSIEVP